MSKVADAFCRPSVLIETPADLGSAFDWLWREGNLPPAIRSTTQIWEVKIQ